MANKPRWTEARGDGILSLRLRKWDYLGPCIANYLQKINNYIYRGQADARWLLLPTLDRMLPRTSAAKRSIRVAEHLAAFKLSTRGRRGPHPREIPSDDEWWALGQHNGLATPLLDWTSSPYVAAYFAMQGKPPDGARECAVFALQASVVEDYCSGGVDLHGAGQLSPPGGKALPDDESLRAVVPLSDENSRLVNQGGLFTRSPSGIDVEAWVRKHFVGVDKGILVKMTFPVADRNECLLSLNRMNINHLTLFPDLYGASRHCNNRLTIPNY